MRNESKKQSGSGQVFVLSAGGVLRLAVRCALGLPLLVFSGVPSAAPFGSAQWIADAAAVQQAPVQSPSSPGGGGGSGIGAVPGRVITPQEAQQAAQRSILNLTRATQAIVAAREAQRVAHQQALQSASGLIGDGLVAGGLQVSAQAAADLANPAACGTSFSCVWQNATLPVQTSAGEQTVVTVQQQANKALLTWDSFNIGANTTLHIDQTQGTGADGFNNWIALNRVAAGTEPSRILGTLKAEGSVYVLNANGIIFGGSSQVNTHSLLASSLPLFLPSTATSLTASGDASYLRFSNRLFLESGLTDVGTDSPAGNILGLNSGQNAPLSANTVLPGAVTLEQGANVQVGKLGYALFAAPTVENAGAISATEGQVILAGGVGVSLKAAASNSQLMLPVLTGRINDVANGFADATPTGHVSNSGLIEAARGDVRLLSANVTQSGVIATTTSISRPGSILLSAIDEQSVDSSRGRTGSLVLDSGSVTTILPDANGETTVSSAAATQEFKAGSVTLTGAAVTLRGTGEGAALNGALVAAPGQNVTVAAIAQNDPNVSPRAIQDGAQAGRVYLERDAVIDVAGIADNALDMSVNFISVPRLGLNELADSPLQRDSILFGASLVIDSRISGTRADGVEWVGTSLANLRGYVEQISRDINRMLLNGGNVDLAGNEVIQRQGAELNLDAGYLRYVNGGNTPGTTRLVNANGTLVDIGQASADGQYVGFAGKTVSNFSRWNITTIASDPLSTGGRVSETDYIHGGNAGQLRVFAASTTLLDGDTSATTWAGRYQVGKGQLPLAGSLQIGPGDNNALFNRIYPDSPAVQAARSYLIVNDALSLEDILGDEVFTATTALPAPALAIDDKNNWQRWTQVSTTMLRDAGFSRVSVTADDPASTEMGGEINVAEDALLQVRDGGSIALTGARVQVDGDLQATAGRIALTATGRTDRIGTTVRPDAGTVPVSGDIVLGANASIDARGEWVNDTGRGEDDIAGAAFINGGSVVLQTLQSSTVGTTAAQKRDVTGSIQLQEGSRIDVSSGGRLTFSGAIAGGEFTPNGRGGSIALETYVPPKLNFGDIGASPLPTVELPPQSGMLSMDGTLAGYGFNGGGTLSLRALGIQIGGTEPALARDLWLPESFFAQQGFDSLQLRAEYNATIADGTTLNLQQWNYLPNVDRLRDLPTGSDFTLTNATTLGLRDPYFRRPLNLSLHAGDYVNWVTSAFATPDYSTAGIDGSVVLGRNAAIIADPGAAITLGSNTQVTVLGSIVAHGGSITLSGDTGDGGYAQNPGLISAAYTAASKSVWLGADSVLDVSGVAQLNPLNTATHSDGTPVRTGRVLDGGTVTLSNDTGYVVATACANENASCSSDARATINVSGTHAAFDFAQAGDFGDVYETVDIGSNAGTVRLGAGAGLFFNGRISAHAGNTNAQGGTLLVTPENGRIRASNGAPGALRLEVFDHAAWMPASAMELTTISGNAKEISAITLLQPGERISGSPFTYLSPDWKKVPVTAGVLQFSTSVLQDSGLSTLRLGSDPLRNTSQVPVPVVFVDDTHIAMSRELSINTSVLTATPPQINSSGSDTTVTLSDVPISVNLAAPYVALTGFRYGGAYTSPAAALRFGDMATLQVNAAQALDVGGQIRMDNWNTVDLQSGGDLRFLTPSTYAFLGNPDNAAEVSRTPGLLETTADLTLTAAQIYPATDERFVIKANATYDQDVLQAGTTETPQTPVFVRGTVSFAQLPAAPETPLPFSVGGSLVVDARRIEQGGVLRAPGGQIVLGLGTSAMEAAKTWDGQSLELLRYDTLGSSGEALERALSGVLNTRRYYRRDGVLTRTVLEKTVLPMLAAESVNYNAGSETSVALGNQVLPYGSTVDALNLRYNGSATSAAGAASAAKDLDGVRSKQVMSTADSVDVQAGALIDLGGGGSLQAQEWVAGTGGSRDVLAASYNRFVGGVAVSTSLYADAREVYAILPGYALPLAPYDPELVSAPLIGKTVWLSGADGLPAGNYTLLPARYATLPGAWRVVQDTAVHDFSAALNQRLPDGTLQVAGHFADALSGARDARTSAFLLQSGSVWRQYSEYRLTDLNSYFSDPARAATANALPRDAGRFSVFADARLQLDGEFRTQRAGGAGAELAIAAPALQVFDDAAVLRDGYLQLDVTDLNRLDFSRLLLGGSSLASGGVDILKPRATAIEIATTQTPLQADDILLVTRSDADGDGIHITDGSQMLASGTASGTRNRPLQMGLNRRFDLPTLTWQAAYSGSGSLLRLSNAGAVTITHQNPLNDAQTALQIGSNVSLTGNSVALDSTGYLNVDASARFATDALALASERITFGDVATPTSADGLVIGNDLFASFSDVSSLSLLGRERISFAGDASISTQNSLSLSAGTLALAGHDVTLQAPVLTLANPSTGVAAASAGSGTLHIVSDELHLGGGSVLLDQAQAVDIVASRQILATGSGALDFGAATVALHTPRITVGTGIDTRLASSAAMQIDASGSSTTPASTASGVGGSLTLDAGSLHIDTQLLAPAGIVALKAADDITLGNNANISTAGLARNVFGTAQNLQGGALQLHTQHGDIAMATGALLDVSAGGGAARGGRLDVSATAGAVSLQGELRGHAGAENGAVFKLTAFDAVDLDALADRLLAGGIDGAVAISSAQGNLQLSEGHVLKAQRVALTASGGSGSTDTAQGNVTIDGVIDASGRQGGNVDLAARGTLTVNGSIDAHGNAADKRGGEILLRTDAGANGNFTDTHVLYGHENVSAAESGAVLLTETAVLDVSGGTSAGLSGGVIRWRAPLLRDGEVNVSVADGATLRGAREVSLEATATWDTRDASSGAFHFDGIIDPAGQFSSAGVAQANADHATFYTQVLRDFVRQPGFTFSDRFAGIDGFNARAGIVLKNADANVNGGDIRVAGNWNLGAGTLDADGLHLLDYRTGNYWAPVLTLDAAHDVVLAASLSDGFYQRVNPFGASTDNDAAPVSISSNPLPIASAGLAGLTRNSNGEVTRVDSTSFVINAGHDIRMTGREQSLSSAASGGRIVAAPTTLRTGTGYIALNAGNDFVLDDVIAPGVIYTAGRIADGTSLRAASKAMVIAARGFPTFLDSGTAHPEGAGNLSLQTGNDILAIQKVTDTAGTRTGATGANLTQFWWPWLQRACLVANAGCTGELAESSLNFAMFGQGLMSTGGDINVAAGGRIRDLSVSLPVTWKIADDGAGNATVMRYGGGDLDLFAQDGISSGSWFVGNGNARISTLGSIDDDIVDSIGVSSFTLGTAVALQDGVIDVHARGSIDIDGIHNPSYLFKRFDSLNYSADSAVNLWSAGGSILLGREAVLPGEAYGVSRSTRSVHQRAYEYVLPASLSAQAWAGEIAVLTRGELYPSARGQLSLIADGNVTLYSQQGANNSIFGMIDVNPALLPSPLKPVGSNAQKSFIDNGAASRFDLHAANPLHAAATEPVRIVSVSGSIVDSNPASLAEGLMLVLPKRAEIRAGKDIVNLSFSGQNLYVSDITTISAGRDLYNTPLQAGHSVPAIELGGPGVLAVSAGRHIGPLTSSNDAYQYGYLPRQNPSYPGIRSVANERNAWLSRSGADISLSFGIAPGVAFDDFAARYIDSAVTLDVNGLRDNTRTPDYRNALIGFVAQFRRDEAQRSGAPMPVALSAADAWNFFLAMPPEQRSVFANRVFLTVLNRVGFDYNDASSPFRGEYLRGYQAINTLYPADSGYTRNALNGVNGADVLVETGTFDMRGSTVQTRHGGDISVFGPGGRVLVGSASAPPNIPASNLSAGVGPGTQGILAMEAGDIGVFTDASVLLAQSRIFTVQGGDLLIWSSNGDINAGKGAKTSSEVPPTEFLCDPDHFCLVDSRSQVGGAGIAVLQTRPGAPSGSANLVAPRGTVDAGDAGIRVAGRLNVAAFQVANADNIKVAGAAIGVPGGAVDTGALSAANAAGAATARAAESVAAASARSSEEAATGLLDVAIIDYGNADCASVSEDEKNGRCKKK